MRRHAAEESRANRLDTVRELRGGIGMPREWLKFFFSRVAGEVLAKVFRSGRVFARWVKNRCHFILIGIYMSGGGFGLMD